MRTPKVDQGRLSSRFKRGGLVAAATALAISTAFSSAAVQGAIIAPLLGSVQNVLPRDMNGQEAILHLGPKINDVALKIGMPVDALIKLLKSDRTLWISKDGSQYYVDPVTKEWAGSSFSDSENVAEGPVTYQALSNTFKLHSLPGSKHTLYLNFKGYKTGTRTLGTSTDGTPLLDGGTWGSSFTSVPYDTDGDPTSFSVTEQQYIQRVWMGVSEAYSPFDIDVTTEAPSVDQINRTNSSDDTYGTILVFTDPTKRVDESTGKVVKDGNQEFPPVPYHQVAEPKNGRSVASVGVFDQPSLHDYYQPGWVFLYPPRPYHDPQNPEFAGTSSTDAAQTATHEGAHTLGLRHDGNRDANGNLLNGGYYEGHSETARVIDDPTSWAPIMGSGAHKVNQWSKLEYPRPNITQGQYVTNGSAEQPDDYLVFASRGVVTRADVVGGTVDTAAALGGTKSGNTFTVAKTGIIESPKDVDCYSFDAGAGNLNITASTAPITPMLDIKLSLYNGSGMLLVSDDSTDQVASAISKNLTTGRYVLCVDGTGNSKKIYGYPGADVYSDYGSIGQYKLVGSYTGSGAVAPVAKATATPTSGQIPLAVKFSSAGSSDLDPNTTGPLQYLWNFGDGSATSTAANPSYTYTKAGSYNAVLKVTTTSGQVSTANVTITATAPDTTPDPFSFQSRGNAAFNLAYDSAVVTISGLGAGVQAPISIINGKYRINGGSYTSADGVIMNGQTLQVQQQSAATSSTTVKTTVAVGTFSTSFSITTAVADTTPDAFTFTAQTGVPFKNEIQSNRITVSGINFPTPISVVGGEYRLNQGPWVSAAGTVLSGQQVRLRHTSANAGNKTVSTNLTIGGVAATFTSTTGALEATAGLADAQPDQFTFVDQTGVAKSKQVTSAIVTVKGFTLAAPISVTGGQYCIGPQNALCSPTGAGWTTSAGTLTSALNTVSVRHTSAANGNATINTTITIGGVTDTFSSTTAP